MVIFMFSRGEDMYYLNDINVLIYLWMALIGVYVGMLSSWLYLRLPEKKKVFSKEIQKEYKNNYFLIFSNLILYVLLLYRVGLNVDLLKFGILVPMLILVFAIDYKLLIIPNRLNLIMFEIGLVFAFVYGLGDINLAIDMGLRNVCWRVIISYYHFGWRINSRQRSYGIWRC